MIKILKRCTELIDTAITQVNKFPAEKQQNKTGKSQHHRHLSYVLIVLYIWWTTVTILSHCTQS